jgi:flagellar biosynthesis chaperone FliJ
MAGILNAGKVIYEVDMDTAGILRGRREIEAALAGLGGNLGRIESSVNRTERSIASMERTLSSLSSIAKGVIAALSIQQVANYADAWTELNNKVSNSIRTGETQAEVMQRIFDISQATQSSLNGTATLYARLERGTPVDSWVLYVADCNMDGTDVNVSLSMTNPLNRNIGRIYDPAEWPGLVNG